MLRTDCSFDEWSAAFQRGIDDRDPQIIKKLLPSLPKSLTYDQMRRLLLQTMDAEAMICDTRNQLDTLRSSLLSKIA